MRLLLQCDTCIRRCSVASSRNAAFSLDTFGRQALIFVKIGRLQPCSKMHAIVALCDGYFIGRIEMRYVIGAVALLAISLGASTPSSAQTGRSVQDLFNACVDQAKKAGWSEQDLGNNRDAARAYVVRCMQGRAGAAKKKKG